MKRWIVKDNSGKGKIVSPQEILSKILFLRDVKDYNSAQDFLNPNISKLHSCMLLSDMEIAVKRINKAISSKEKILVFSDYDVDGVTSLAIFTDFLLSKNAQFDIVIPHRISHGYGFNKEAVDLALSKNINLIITLDCGSNSEWVNYASSLNIDVIVVDHHNILQDITPLALINPKNKSGRYPFADLSACGVTFKLIEALKGDFPAEYLDLVALSIVSDVVPVLGENRVLLVEGIKKIRQSPCLGLDALLDVSKIKKEKVDVFHLGWILGPRINASGRIDSAKISYDLLSSKDKSQALTLAKILNEKNRQRQDISNKVYLSALSKIEPNLDLDNDFVLVGSGLSWHQGVLGIVASKIKERFLRPTILISFDDQGIGKGSARSIDNFNITEALFKCKDILRKVGGHKKAAGLEIDQHNLSAFKEGINAAVKDLMDPQDLQPCLEIDYFLDFSNINEDLALALSNLAPFGEANPEPLFSSDNLTLKNVSSYYNKKVFWVQNSGLIYPLICNSSEQEDVINCFSNFNIVYTMRYDAKLGVLLKLKDIKTC